MGLRRPALWFRRAVVVAVGISATGYASSVASRGPAERAAANRIASELGTRNVYVIADDPTFQNNYPGSSAVLSRAGLTVHDCDRTGGRLDCFPWVGMSPGKVLGPFAVEVRWGRERGGLSGYGARTRYLAFFGVVFPIRDVFEWVT